MKQWHLSILAFATLAGMATAQSNQTLSSFSTDQQQEQITRGAKPGTNHCYPRAGLFGGASLYLVRPYFENNAAFVSTTGTNVAAVTTTTNEFDWNFQAAPAIWLGWAFGNGVAARARYFHFNQSSNSSNATLTAAQAINGNLITAPLTVAGGAQFGAPSTTLLGLAGQDNLAFRSGLEIDSVDVETTFEWQTGQWFFVLSTGGRYLRLTQSYDATLNNPGGATERQRLSSVNRFNGGGPTVAAEARWDLGPSRWSLFGLLRGSLLVGQVDNDVLFTDVSPGVFAISSQASSSLTRLLPVTELELGVEYGSQWRGTNYFLRTAVVNQVYFDAGNASNQDGNLSLFGMQFSLGVNY